ncbi:globin domain-containing protein [uncultured Tyzzerella sp.]|uniref:globin domain-containing protein n=1 Tax=uncultured Tyzzerella sp. TaxID=2321398 RepID=UPI002942F635|nr:globin domain-containing protein [uncultured Tyzzerella sp.]
MLDAKTIEIIKSTVPVLQEKGVEITKYFYKTMFENNPEVKPMFDMDKQASGAQPVALANAILAAAKNIDNLEAIMPAVKSIGERHVEVGVLAEHYPIVGKNLLIAIKDMLGDAATDEIMQAWEKTYGVLAEVFIKVEKEMYDAKN